MPTLFFFASFLLTAKLIPTAVFFSPTGIVFLPLAASPADLQRAVDGFPSVEAYTREGWVDERVRDGSLRLVQSASRISTTVAAVAPPPSVPPLSPEERFNALLAQVHTALRLAGAKTDLFQGFLQAPPAGLETAFAGQAIGRPILGRPGRTPLGPRGRPEDDAAPARTLPKGWERERPR